MDPRNKSEREAMRTKMYGRNPRPVGRDMLALLDYIDELLSDLADLEALHKGTEEYIKRLENTHP